MPAPARAEDAAGQTADRQFVAYASAANMAAEEMSMLACEQAGSPAVRQYGLEIIKSHSRANQELRKATAQKGLPLSAEVGKEHREVIGKLQRLKGREFDRAYLGQMIRDQEQSLARLEAQVTGGGEPGLRAYAAGTVPTVREQLRRARALAAAVGAGESSREK